MKIKTLTRAAMFAAITAVLAQIAIPLPFSPVPLTLSVLAVLITGGMLDCKTAVLSQLIYLLIGAVGLPVFAGFQGGVVRLVGPTGGYLMAYPIMALAVSFCVSKFKGKATIGLYVGSVIAVVVCYSFGTVWLSIVGNMTFVKALTVAVVPYIIPDLIKIALGVQLTLAMRKMMPKQLTA